MESETASCLWSGWWRWCGASRPGDRLPRRLPRGRRNAAHLDHRVSTQCIAHYRALITYLDPVVPALAERSATLLGVPIEWLALDEPLLGSSTARFRPLLMGLAREDVDKLVAVSAAKER